MVRPMMTAAKRRTRINWSELNFFIRIHASNHMLLYATMYLLPSAHCDLLIIFEPKRKGTSPQEERHMNK